MIEYYNKNGQQVNDGGFYVAKKVTDELGEKFWLLNKSGKLFNPSVESDRSLAKEEYRWKMTSVGQQVFESYMAFLTRKEPRFYRQAQREFING